MANRGLDVARAAAGQSASFLRKAGRPWQALLPWTCCSSFSAP